MNASETLLFVHFELLPRFAEVCVAFYYGAAWMG